MPDYAKILRKIMDDHGLGQEEMAEILSVSQANVYKMLSGKTKNPSASTLAALYNRFKINPDVLLGKEYKHFYNLKTD